MIVCSDLPVGKPLCICIGTTMVCLHICWCPCQNPKYCKSSEPVHLFPNPFSMPVTYILELQWGYPTQFSMSGKLTKTDMEYHTSIFYDKINFYWSKIEFKYQGELILFPSIIQVPLHGKFKTRKLLTCLDPQYRIVIQMSKHCLCIRLA